MLDPHSKVSQAEIAEQQKMFEGLRDLQERSARLINEIEWQRRELAELRSRLADRPKGETKNPNQDLIDASQKTDEALQAIEGLFFDLRFTQPGQDSLRWKRLLYAKISQLGWQVGRADAKPTDSQHEVFSLLAQQVKAAEESFAKLTTEELAKLEKLLAERQVGPIQIGQLGVRVPEDEFGRRLLIVANPPQLEGRRVAFRL